jgi:hypothetical protein
MSDQDISGATPGPLKLLIVDTTGNKGGFEHATTLKIHQALRDAGVDVLAPVFASSMADFLKATNQEFSALLWVAHGAASKGETVSSVSIGATPYAWQLIANSGLNLAEKLVALCVCSAGNDDMTVSMQKSDVFALMTVASSVTLGADEALRFFPALFQKLNPTSIATIEPQLVKEAVVELSNLAGNKMRFFGP